ncbi:MAG: D-glycero-beta-D-manno-heptose-7-phosphate kinase [Candidatus Cloacimonetes bacterium]|nr:D-glycero-beta-D-manno-heptose-7-phosphate kinase [Candidatus Cloacimonadota bacterium]
MMDIQELGKQIKGLRAIVLGDMMLDSYLWGKVQRISPEAPVPVIEINREEYRLGGAANVALNLISLGAEVFAVGLVGSEANAKVLKKLFKQHGLSSKGLVSEMGRKTTIKTRIGAVNQQIVRIDIEDSGDLSDKSKEAILLLLKKQLEHSDLLIIEDYNKGLLREDLISETPDLCKKHNVMVALDRKQKNFFKYRKVDIFKPNYKELQSNLGRCFESEADFFEGAAQVQKKLACKYLVVTHGAKGMYIFSAKSPMLHLPSCAREVYDVSGAGDTVIGASGLAMASWAYIHTAANFTNLAAGVVCGKMGTATANIEELRDYAQA